MEELGEQRETSGREEDSKCIEIMLRIFISHIGDSLSLGESNWRAEVWRKAGKMISGEGNEHT